MLNYVQDKHQGVISELHENQMYVIDFKKNSWKVMRYQNLLQVLHHPNLL